jgi:hypothetical protein
MTPRALLVSFAVGGMLTACQLIAGMEEIELSGAAAT